MCDSGKRSSVLEYVYGFRERIYRSTETRHVTGRGTLGIRWAFVCHSLRTFSICWTNAIHALPFVTMNDQHSSLIRWAFVLFIRGSLRNMFWSRFWAYLDSANFREKNSVRYAYVGSIRNSISRPFSHCVFVFNKSSFVGCRDKN